MQDLLYAARSLGVHSMWTHGLQVMRRKSWNNGEVSYLPSINYGIYRMLPFCRIKHVYRVAGLVQWLEFKHGSRFSALLSPPTYFRRDSWIVLKSRGGALTTRRLSAQVLPNTQETMIFLRGKSWSFVCSKIEKCPLHTFFPVNRLSL